MSATAVSRRASLSTVERWLVGLELTLAAAATYGGVMFLTHLQNGFMPASTLDDLGLDSFLLPGIALLVVNGLVPLVVAIGTLRHRPWTVPAHVGVGIVLVLWILVQIPLIGFAPVLHPVYLAWGVALIVLGAKNAAAHERPRLA